MKKLKKSVKALIISGVSLLCVLAITLGLVFGLKKPGDNKTPGGNPSGPSVPSDGYVLTNAQLDLVGQINSAQSAQGQLTLTDYSKLYDENGSSIDPELVTGIYEDYFIAFDANDNQTVYYKQGNNKSVNLLAHMKTKNVITKDYFNAEIEQVKGDYVLYSYSYEESDKQYKSTEVAYVGDLENISVLNKVVIENRQTKEIKSWE